MTAILTMEMRVWTDLARELKKLFTVAFYNKDSYRNQSKSSSIAGDDYNTG